MACGIGGICVSAVLEQVVINFQRVYQVAPHFMIIHCGSKLCTGVQSALYDCLDYICVIKYG